MPEAALKVPVGRQSVCTVQRDHLDDVVLARRDVRPVLE
jgi:hypothetical protein